jgi:hypothetical protein
MAVTPIYGLPYPALSDAPNVPADVQALAEGVETELSTVNGRVDTTNSDVTALDTRVTDTETKVAAAKTAGTSLTDDTAAANNTWERWGTEAVIFTNPGVPVDVTGSVAGAFVNTLNTETDAFTRVAISFDSGSTYTVGNAPGVTVGTSGSKRGPATASAYRAGTPTGNVVVKVEFFVNTTNTKPGAGHLIATMTPQ